VGGIGKLCDPSLIRVIHKSLMIKSYTTTRLLPLGLTSTTVYTVLVLMYAYFCRKLHRVNAYLQRAMFSMQHGNRVLFQPKAYYLANVLTKFVNKIKRVSYLML